MWTLFVWGLSSLLLACPARPQEGEGFSEHFEQDALTHQMTPRDRFGGLKVRLTSERTYVLEARRDALFHSSRRLVVSSRTGGVLWQLDERPGEHFTDFTVHPSGEVTLGVERTGEAPWGYGLVRVSVDGSASPWQPLPRGDTLPDTDLGGDLARRPFQMRSPPSDALTDDWLRLESRGEDLVVAFLSQIESPDGAPVQPSEVASGVMALTWGAGEYRETWCRMVDGRHKTGAVAWAYDEFRWRDAVARPLLSVASDGRVVVGRTWTVERCKAASRIFGEFDRVQDCVMSGNAAPVLEVELQPFAFTVYSPEGAREGTRVFAPALAEFVVFAMDVDGDGVAIAGTAVQYAPDGSRTYYPAEPGAASIMVPYEGYLAVLDMRTGVPRFEHFVDEGRGDYLAALRVTPEGLFAAGASDWDRWNGGMSISRGADPLLVFAPRGEGRVLARRLAIDDPSRHYHLLGVDAEGGTVMGTGLAAAPMTHSSDYQHPEGLTFGGLTVELR